MDTRAYGTCGQVCRHIWHTIFVKRLLKKNLWRDTKQFVDDLRRPHWQDEMRMVKIDIKEFYMSGEARFPLMRLLGAPL